MTKGRIFYSQNRSCLHNDQKKGDPYEKSNLPYEALNYIQWSTRANLKEYAYVDTARKFTVSCCGLRLGASNTVVEKLQAWNWAARHSWTYHLLRLILQYLKESIDVPFSIKELFTLIIFKRLQSENA